MKKSYQRWYPKPTFVNSEIYGENLIAVHKIKECLTLDRPAYVGMCILDLSKTLMYDYHTIQSRKCMGILPSCCLQTLIPCVMRSKQRTPTKKICLTSVIIPKRVHILTQQIRKCQVNSKMNVLKSQWVDCLFEIKNVLISDG